MSLTDFVASRRALAGFLLAMFPAGSALAATRVLRGTVSYRERIALPPKAIVEVKLLDVSRADAPAHVIAETRVSGRRIPAHWTLRFDPREVQSRHSYALQARILLARSCCSSTRSDMPSSLAVATTRRSGSRASRARIRRRARRFLRSAIGGCSASAAPRCRPRSRRPSSSRRMGRFPAAAAATASPAARRSSARPFASLGWPQP